MTLARTSAEPSPLPLPVRQVWSAVGENEFKEVLKGNPLRKSSKEIL